MSNPSLGRLLGLLAVAGLVFAPSARAELAAWDQAKVNGLAKELGTATDALYKAFIQHPPPPDPGSMQSASYYRLRYLVWMLRSEALMLVEWLEKGDGREQTSWIYEEMTSYARTARDEASRVFVAKDVGERAAAVRGLLNQLGPYYDPDFRTLIPNPHIEPDANR